MLNEKKKVILKVENISMVFRGKKKFLQKPKPGVKAVSNVSFEVNAGETFGIVGESGCGKTTLGKCIMRLLVPEAGKLMYNDEGEWVDLLNVDKQRGFELRKKLQIVFQDPFSSLNPMHTILEAFDEPMRVHGIGGNKEQRKELIAKALESVNLQSDYMYRYPHEFSGGQRQRLCVAKALAMGPKLIVLDEPVSALDVSIQAQLLNLLRKLQRELGISFIFIAHDLSVVQYISDRVGVMYLGNMVEIADADEVYKKPLHPYTEALLSAVPMPVVGAKKDRIILTGDVPSPMNPPSGCPFNPRCTKCMEICKETKPELRKIGDSNHYVACHLYDEKA